MKMLWSWLDRMSDGPRCGACGRLMRGSSREIHRLICPDWIIDAMGQTKLQRDRE